MTTIDPPQVRLPLTLEKTAEAKWWQGQATVLYQIWDALRKLGTSNSSIISNSDLAETFVVACSDETTALTTGIKKAVFRAPYDCTIEEITGGVTTAPTGATLLEVDIGVNGTSILTTRMYFDASEKTTRTASVPLVISADELEQDDEIRIDIINVGSTIAGTGLKVTFKLKRTSS